MVFVSVRGDQCVLRDARGSSPVDLCSCIFCFGLWAESPPPALVEGLQGHVAGVQGFGVSCSPRLCPLLSPVSLGHSGGGGGLPLLSVICFECLVSHSPGSPFVQAPACEAYNDDQSHNIPDRAQAQVPLVGPWWAGGPAPFGVDVEETEPRGLRDDPPGSILQVGLVVTL